MGEMREMAERQKRAFLLQLIHEWTDLNMFERLEVILYITDKRLRSTPLIGNIYADLARKVTMQRTKRMLIITAATIAASLTIYVASQNWAAGVVLGILVGYLIAKLTD